MAAPLKAGGVTLMTYSATRYFLKTKGYTTMHTIGKSYICLSVLRIPSRRNHAILQSTLIPIRAIIRGNVIDSCKACTCIGFSQQNRSYSRNNGTCKLVLGIETSCDDTGVAVVDNYGTVIGDAINSQIKTHVRYVHTCMH